MSPVSCLVVALARRSCEKRVERAFDLVNTCLRCGNRGRVVASSAVSFGGRCRRRRLDRISRSAGSDSLRFPSGRRGGEESKAAPRGRRVPIRFVSSRGGGVVRGPKAAPAKLRWSFPSGGGRRSRAFAAPPSRQRDAACTIVVIFARSFSRASSSSLGALPPVRRRGTRSGASSLPSGGRFHESGSTVPCLQGAEGTGEGDLASRAAGQPVVCGGRVGSGVAQVSAFGSALIAARLCRCVSRIGSVRFTREVHEPVSRPGRHM